MHEVLGIHHVTAIASDPQRNRDFYAGVLGMRLVKKTVNFDDPFTYHLYYGDERGTPGGILTFFPWPGAPRGRHGSGQASVVSFAVVPAALDAWHARLREAGVDAHHPAWRGQGPDAERFVAFADPDGLRLELVAHAAAAERDGWGGAEGITREQAIRGFHDVTFLTPDPAGTERALTSALGYRRIRADGGTVHMAVGDGGPGRTLRVHAAPAAPAGILGAGIVHHVAFAVPDEEAQHGFRDEAVLAGLDPTPVIDRRYFRSVYFGEPGGVLLELATVPPGFTVDEPLDLLGESLQLPPWLETERRRIERALPPLATTPAARQALSSHAGAA